jgi:hypothetical protein
MTLQRFWKLIAATAKLPEEDHTEALQAELARLPADEILAFSRQYDALIDAAGKTDLWGAAYVINGGCSDDGFHYFRVWLVGQGKKVYEKALADPDSLADILGPDDADTCESGLDSAAAQAWMEKTGRSDEEFYKELERLAAADKKEPVEEGEAWDFDDDEEVRRRLPRLSRIFLEEED